ncbi:hypothetical protein FHETE_113 [Fusarium heterosporum]|uniref:Uncharacterized protein n=1 Tax=Fusarium heterosporum TaxID=42747 RepID=A0A8H5U7E8_FUSHE|nr:hypothetical protein FHETE_113 [Fusarium heterosporum]
MPAFKSVRFAEPLVGPPSTTQKSSKRKRINSLADGDIVEQKKPVKDVEVVVLDKDDNPHKRRLRPRKPKTPEAEPKMPTAEPAKKKPKVALSRKRKTAEPVHTEPATGVKRIKIVRSGTSKKAKAKAQATVPPTTKGGRASKDEESLIKDESSDDVLIIKSHRAVIAIDSTDESST